MDATAKTQFIVTASFEDLDLSDQTVTVWASNKAEAVELVDAWYADTTPTEEIDIATIAEFESDSGTFTQDMFTCINPPAI